VAKYKKLLSQKGNRQKTHTSILFRSHYHNILEQKITQRRPSRGTSQEKGSIPTMCPSTTFISSSLSTTKSFSLTSYTSFFHAQSPPFIFFVLQDTINFQTLNDAISMLLDSSIMEITISILVLLHKNQDKRKTLPKPQKIITNEEEEGEEEERRRRSSSISRCPLQHSKISPPKP
jgi:hypothetical protein